MSWANCGVLVRGARDSRPGQGEWHMIAYLTPTMARTFPWTLLSGWYMFTLIEHRFFMPIPRVSLDGTTQGQLVGEQCYMKVFNLQIFDLLSELYSLLALVLPLSIPSQQGYTKGNNGSTSWHKREDLISAWRRLLSCIYLCTLQPFMSQEFEGCGV